MVDKSIKIKKLLTNIRHFNFNKVDFNEVNFFALSRFLSLCFSTAVIYHAIVYGCLHKPMEEGITSRLFIKEMRILGQPENRRLSDYKQERDNWWESSYHFMFDYTITDEEVISYYKQGLKKTAGGWFRKKKAK